MKIVNKKRFGLFIASCILLLAIIVGVGVNHIHTLKKAPQYNAPEVTHVENVNGEMVYYFDNGTVQKY